MDVYTQISMPPQQKKTSMGFFGSRFLVQKQITYIFLRTYVLESILFFGNFFTLITESTLQVELSAVRLSWTKTSTATTEPSRRGGSKKKNTDGGPKCRKFYRFFWGLLETHMYPENRGYWLSP